MGLSIHHHPLGSGLQRINGNKMTVSTFHLRWEGMEGEGQHVMGSNVRDIDVDDDPVWGADIW